MVLMLKKSTVAATKTVTEIVTKKKRARQGGMESPDSQPKASDTAKHSEATRMGSAMSPEPMMPNEKRKGPSCPKGPGLPPRSEWSCRKGRPHATAMQQ